MKIYPQYKIYFNNFLQTHRPSLKFSVVANFVPIIVGYRIRPKVSFNEISLKILSFLNKYNEDIIKIKKQ
jgi:hypothetical protein